MSEHDYALIGKYFCYIVATVTGLALVSVLYIAGMYLLLRKFRLLRSMWRITNSVLDRQPKSSDYDKIYGPLMYTTMIERDGSTWDAMN